jgi:glycosyltransferase involved in cell wall biosynthesis
VVVFVGALGTDTNKGFDILWDAWKRLTAEGDWDAQLIVAGGGWRVEGWRDEAAPRGWSSSVRFLGFTSRVRDVLAAGDLLVSPVHYEAYGLNVHEALCRGLSVMVSRQAGVVERFDPAMSDAVLPENITAAALADRLRAWRHDMPGWRSRALSTAARVRARSWSDMAVDFVDTVQNTRQLIPA